ncbi:MAG: metal ABC transporter solute-binding protein, Zn/Mn family, partial [Acidimicrobiales bacterium]
TVDRQISEHQIRVFVYNSQNSTPDIQSLVAHARASGIPVTAVTETLSPASASFQDWQARQLQALADALRKASGR